MSELIFFAITYVFAILSGAMIGRMLLRAETNKQIRTERCQNAAKLKQATINALYRGTDAGRRAAQMQRN